MRRRRSARLLAALLPAVLLTAGAGRAVAQAAPGNAADTAYTPTQDFPNGRQVVAVYFGASWCAPCRRPETKDAIRRMKPLVAAQAKQLGAAFAAMAVALDRDLDKGLEFVRPNGAFDEYVFGSDLVSTAAERFIWADSLAAKAVPQVIVFERTVNAVPRTPITFGPARVLARVGGDSIPLWVRAGAPIGR